MAGSRKGINQREKNPNFRHGMADTRPWNSWFDMLRRCERPYVKTYKHYGGRGIKVCARWHSFEKFWEDMGPTYKDNLTLERIDNNGNYEPSNCTWITKQEQQRNKRNVRHFTINGVTKPLPEWLEITGLKRTTVEMRHYKCGWSMEESLFTPVGKKREAVS